MVRVGKHGKCHCFMSVKSQKITQYNNSPWAIKLISWLICIISSFFKSFYWIYPDWWFGTCFIFPYTSIGNNHPNWRTYFSDGLKPPTSLILLTSIHTAEIVDFPSHGILGLPRVPTSTMVPCQLRQWLLWRERAGSHSGCWVIPWDRGRPHETNGETNGPRVRPDGFFDAKLSMFDVEITSWFNWSKL
jgi:hypothetical protein